MQSLILDGNEYVVLPRAEYERLSGVTLPELPPADKDGARPAVAFARATIARDLIARRQAIGLSQGDLAKAAGIAAEVLNRIERAKTSGRVRTLDKIEAALVEAEKSRGNKK